MSAPPFMQLWVADYLGDTRHLTTEQHGAYLLLLMSMWRAGARLPNDPAKLARYAGLSMARWRKIGADVLTLFEDHGDEIGSKKLTEEYEKAIQKSKIRARSGKAGGDAKALKDKKPAVANASVLPCHSSDIRDHKDTPSKEGVARTRLSKGERLPENWQPKPAHFALGATFGKDARWVHGIADTMRDWAKANGHRQVGRKSDWDATFSNFIRNDGAKARGSPARPASSGWLEAGADLIGEQERSHEPDSDQGDIFGAAGESRTGARRYDPQADGRGGGYGYEVLDIEPIRTEPYREAPAEKSSR